MGSPPCLSCCLRVNLWTNKLQVGVPSRTEVAEYRDLGSQVNELVGRINGNYGTLEYSPVHYINQSISQVCTGVCSIGDGMIFF